MAQEEYGRHSEPITQTIPDARSMDAPVAESPPGEVVPAREPSIAPQATADAAGEVVSPRALRRGYVPAWRARLPHIVAPTGAMLVMAAAVLTLVATFLNWVQGSSGWNIMFRSFGTNGTFLFTWWSRGLLFSGFTSLLLGILVAAGAVMLFADRNGGNLVLACGIAGLLLALFDIVMVYANSLYFPAGPGPGLWVFAGVSLATVVLGLTVVPAGAFGEAAAD